MLECLGVLCLQLALVQIYMLKLVFLQLLHYGCDSEDEAKRSHNSLTAPSTTKLRAYLYINLKVSKRAARHVYLKFLENRLL